VLLTPTDNLNILNFINFNDIGGDTLKTANAFKKIQVFSKTNPQQLFESLNDFTGRYGKLYDLYISNNTNTDTITYGTTRQHNYTPNLAFNNNNITYLDKKSLNTCIVDTSNQGMHNKLNYNLSLYKAINTYFKTNATTHLSQHTLQNNFNTFIRHAYTDDKINHEVIKTLFYTKPFKKKYLNSMYSNSDFEFLSNSKLFKSVNLFPSLKQLYTNTIYKSPNQHVLTSDRNVRLNIQGYKQNFNLAASNTKHSPLYLDHITSASKNFYKSLYTTASTE
jgi:hypothetical protein